MANNDAELRIGGNIDALKEATNKATSEVKRMADGMQSSLGSLNSAFQKINGTFMAFTAALAGGAAFKAVISASNDWALESGKLAKALGTTTEEASIMKVAMNHVGVDADLVVSASQKMSKQIFSNGEAFKTLGVAVKDAAGNYRPVTEVMGEVNEKLAAIKNPIAQNIAGQQIYGKGWAEVKAVLKLTAEQMEWARQRAKDLHLIVGPEGEAQAKQYKSQMRDLQLVGKSLEVQFGQALTPVFVKMGAWMGEEAPRVGAVFKNILLAVAASAMTVWEVINGLGNALGGFAAMAAAVLHGDIAGAKAIYAEMEADNKRTAARVREIWVHAFDTPVSTSSVAPDMTKSGPDFGSDNGGKADKSRTAAWESELAEAKVFFQKTYELREYSKEQEKEYWQSILRNVQMTGQERIAVTKKISELDLEIMKKSLQQKKALDAEAINDHEKTAMDGLAMEEVNAQREYDLGAINKEQLLALHRDYEDRRFAIEQEAQSARIAAMLGDPNRDPVALQQLLDHMLEIQRAHDLRVAKINTDAAVSAKQSWESTLAPIGSAFEKTVTGLIQGTLTMKKALSGIFNSIIAEFVNMCVKMGLKWAATELAKTSIVKSETLLRSAFEAMGIIKTEAAKTAATTTAIATNEALAQSAAGLAAVNAMASVAAIPFYGWAMAPAVGAETFGIAEGFAAVAAASGGYDIPSGVNPVTQLHQEEMVLPAHIANPLRENLANGGGSGGGAVHMHVHTQSTQDFKRFLTSNSHTMAPALRRLVRNFTPVK